MGRRSWWGFAILLLSACAPDDERSVEIDAPPAADDTRTPAPSTTQDAWQEAVFARIAQGEYAIRDGGGTPSAFNRAQGLRATFAPDGVRVSERVKDDTGVRLTATAVGRTDERRALEDTPFVEGACRKDGARDEMGACLRRVEARRDGIVEWWENTPEGLEQGFDVLQKPAGNGALRIVVKLDAAGSHVDDGGQSATILLPGGKAMSYGKLVAEDAHGRRLPIHLAAAPDGLAIVVDDASAVYPLRVDPLLASDNWVIGTPQAGAAFGSCTGSAGDVNGDGYGDVVIGAPSHDGAFVNGGKAYLFYGTASGLEATPRWTAEGASASAAFGCPATGAGDVNGDSYGDVMVAAPLHDNGQTDEGAVYLYRGSVLGPEPTAGVVLERDVAGARFGSQIVAAGDVDRDGFGDVAVHAATTNEVTVYRGSASPGLATAPSLTYVVPSSSSGTTLSAGDINGDKYADIVMVYSVWGSSGYTHVEFSMGGASGLGAVGRHVISNVQTYVAAMVGDTNGDGRADLAISANSGSDQIQVYCGGPFTPFALCANTVGRVGSIAPAGDVNGDGFADVLGLAQAIPGVLPARLIVYAGKSSTSLSTLSDLYVGSVPVVASPAGDVNGDGLADAVLGVPGYDGTQTDQGLVVFYRGAAAALAPALDQTISPTSAAGAHFGTSLAGLGDMNGDGYGEIAIAAPDYQGKGAAWVYKGSKNGVDANAVWSIVSPALEDGCAVAAAGDVNGDGYADVLVSRPLYFGNERGWAGLYRGDASVVVGSALWTEAGTQASSHFGEGIAGAGDVNGDGYADFAVAASLYDSNGLTDNGRVHVYPGGPAGPGAAIPLDGTCSGGRFGFAIAGVRDMNGDLWDDLAIASPWCNGGRVEVFAGAQAAGQALQTKIRQLDQPQAGARFGVSIAGPGDVNGDRYADLLVGAHLFDGNSNTDIGRASLHYGGPTPPADWVLLGTEADARLGRSVGAAGDVNGDGLGDLVIGSPRFTANDQGRAFVHLGAIGGPSKTASWTSPSLGAEASVELGAAVAGAGDVNGDGYSDILIGAPLADTGDVDAGRVYVQYGNAGKDSTVDQRFLVRRLGTTVPILPGGKTGSTDGFDVALIAKNPSGRTPARLRIQMSIHGNPWGPWTLYSYTEDVFNMVALTGTALTGGFGAAPYFRVRAEYLPSASAPWSLYSPWHYGGVLGDRYGVAVRPFP